MKTFFFILIFSVIAFGQSKSPTVADIELGDCRQSEQRYIQAALDNLKLAQVYADSLHALRDSLSHSKEKKK